MSRLLLSLPFLTLSAGGVPAQDLQLLMFEQPGCIYCARWNEEVAPEYPLTVEGMAAPLRRLQLRDPLPEGLVVVSHPVFTPTFVLVEDGVETDRIEGYPGEDFFWPLLAGMIKDAATD
ncbi:thioredoxin family protein [Tabrizicola sp.]|uniref:thioredoxin family protein n=1 Tax=Tabrizicola sp. TaxID=2005166 RepID=UPI00260BA11A|nr:thioredoxin family protein [Tabrizicola sp.]MDM7931444.1 thioredoxin family protein [Tabrizicola sp.]